MWYAECLKNWYNAVDRTFYDAIKGILKQICMKCVDMSTI